MQTASGKPPSPVYNETAVTEPDRATLPVVESIYHSLASYDSVHPMLLRHIASTTAGDLCLTSFCLHDAEDCEDSTKRFLNIACYSMQDGFADEHTIYGGYNQSPITSAGENGPGTLRLLDNFTFYVQTDDEGSEELVDLQDFTKGLMPAAIASMVAMSVVDVYKPCLQTSLQRHSVMPT